MVYETLNVRQEGPVLFAGIFAPPMNLLGPELVRDLVSLIQQAEADKSAHVLVFKSDDPDYFISHVDVTRVKENREPAKKLTGEPSLGLLFRYLSASRLSPSHRSKVACAALAASSYSRVTCVSPHANRRSSISSNRPLVSSPAPVAPNSSRA